MEHKKNLHHNHMSILTNFLVRTQKCVHFYSVIVRKKVMGKKPTFSRGHLVTLKLSSIEPSQYLDGWPPIEKLLNILFYFFRDSFDIFRTFHSMFDHICSLKCKKCAKNWAKKGFLSNWTSLFDRGSKRSPIQVRLGLMLLQVSH